MQNIVSVVVNRLSRSVDKVFDYIATDEIYQKLRIGSLVFVPFGKGDNIIEAFVIGFPDKSYVEKLKNIVSVNDNFCYFDKELLDVAYYMKERYFATLISAIKTIAPPGIGVHFDKTHEKKIKGVELNISLDDAYSFLELIRDNAPMQTRVVELMIQNDFVSYADVMMITGCARSVIKTLENKGILKQNEIDIYRNTIDFENIKSSKALTPTLEQQYAIERINSTKENKTFLLHGVTGSGKTEVFLQCIEDCIKNNKTAIVLVPEISLTPQMIERFVGRFGKKVAVLHSKLSPGERADEHRKIRNGEISVVVGVRSAIFAPIKNLGLIIIDEEHENSYKSESLPAYHAREIGEFRAKYNNIPIVLASATPDISSYFKTQTGEYELLKLTERANKFKLPDVEIVDMRSELTDGNRSIFSRELKKEIEKNIKKKEQTILFLNRRGFSNFVSCRNCGYTAKCERCNISLTYHKTNDSLFCHYCGYTTRNFHICPQCGSSYIRFFGTGTQRVEDEIKTIFPNASTLRMDVDTTTSKTSHSDFLQKFKEDKIDILIGTQMIAKGLDFPSVTLVGVLAADLGLNMNDFRAGEKTFDLITQVCGRAGRGKLPGRAIIQTYTPESDVITLAKKQDYISFYNNEINIRKTLNYPPYCDIVSILLTSKSNSAVSIYAKKIANYINRALLLNNITGVEVLGPTVSNLMRINDNYRWRILIKGQIIEGVKNIIDKMIVGHSKTKESKWISIQVDLNPNNII